MTRFQQLMGEIVSRAREAEKLAATADGAQVCVEIKLAAECAASGDENSVSGKPAGVTYKGYRRD